MNILNKFFQSHKTELLPYTVSVYLYVLYIRIMYLSWREVIKIRDKDYWNYVKSPTDWYLSAEHPTILPDAGVIVFFTGVLLLASYLFYRRNKYRFAVILYGVYHFFSSLIRSSIFSYSLMNSGMVEESAFIRFSADDLMNRRTKIAVKHKVTSMMPFISHRFS